MGLGVAVGAIVGVGVGLGVAVGAIVGVGVGVGVAAGVGVGARVAAGWGVALGVGAAVGTGLAVGVAVAVGSGVGVLVGTGVGVGVGSGVAVAVGAGVEVGVAVGGGVAEGVAAASGVGVGVGVAVGNGTGVSAGATVAVGCGSVVGSGVAAGADTAVGVWGTVVATAGAACSPPQAARAVRTPKHSSSTAAAFTVPVSLPLMNFMAPFSAPGKVASMTRPVQPSGVQFDASGCLGRSVKPVIVFLLGGSAAGVGPAQRQRGLPVRELGTVGGRDPLNPPVTSTGQNSHCANRNFAVWTPMKSPLRGRGRARPQDLLSGGVGVPSRHREGLPSSNGHDLWQVRSSGSRPPRVRRVPTNSWPSGSSPSAGMPA